MDKLWSDWMATMSGSYVKTLDLLGANKMEEATKEFQQGFVTTVKKLYSQAASTYPTRFAKMDNWCNWAKQLYVLTREAEDALTGGKKAEALKKLAELREHFNGLHEKTQTQKSNDYIHGFRQKVESGKARVEELKALMAALDKAEPSAKAKAEAEAYAKAKAEWSKEVSAILESGKIKRGEIKPLRQSTEKLYREFGIQFE